MTASRTYFHPALAPAPLPLPAWVTTLLRRIGGRR